LRRQWDLERQTSNSNGHGLERRKRSEGPFPRFERGRREGQGWAAIDLGGHEVVAHLRLDMRPGPQAAGEGRHSLDRLEGAIEEETLDNLRLLVTELVTNSVRHGGAEEWIQLDVEIYANAVRVAVCDRGPGFHPPETPEPHPNRPGGWGLCLVDRLADRWGVTLDGRTRVWFEIDRGRERRFVATG
jgi:anti-sigma regulatory factor (Ser/Thr protein kinase)